MEFVVDSRSLHFQVQGSGAPILFVHGFPLSGALWEPVVERLGDGWRAIVPDLRGHGRSAASERVDMGTYAADLLALLDHLGESRPVVLVGLSMGGYIAFEFVRRYPGRVRALVLANTRATADDEALARQRHRTAERVLREGSAVVADSMTDRLFAPAASAPLRDRWREIMAGTPALGVAAALRAMAARADSLATLRSLQRPVLVIAGTDDAIVPLDEAEAMQRAAPDARLTVVPAAGHLTPVEQPDAFTAALQRFLGHVAAPPDPEG